MKAHICSLDGHMWRVIEHGPYEILDNSDPLRKKKKKDYYDADLKASEKNSRTMKVMCQALSKANKKIDVTHKQPKRCGIIFINSMQETLISRQIESLLVLRIMILLYKETTSPLKIFTPDSKDIFDNYSSWEKTSMSGKSLISFACSKLQMG